MRESRTSGSERAPGAVGRGLLDNGGCAMCHPLKHRLAQRPTLDRKAPIDRGGTAAALSQKGRGAEDEDADADHERFRAQQP
jgi:hypothetical protein